MEEDALEEALTQYKQQLNQIDDVLKVSNNGDVGELIKLKEDLVELVKTTEESLLCLKKSKLLKLLDQSCEDNTETEIPEHETFEEDENDDEQYETSNQSCSSLAGTPEIENSMAGTQCQAPYVFDWGVKGYYNAMVLSVEEADEDLGGLKVRVLFTNPTHKSMVPCPYFLDGKCRFVDEECRYSHGCVVNMSELRAYKDPDFSLLKVNGKCLAKYEDNVWYKATILSINEGNVSIHYDTYNMDKSVNLEDVLPIDEAEGSDSSDDEDHEPDQYGDDYNDMEDKVIAEFRANSADSCGMLGDWEKHTKGIASKLMAKMGYVVGKGLGKHEDGRVEPVEIILLPTGKSLDACAELREKKKLKEPFKRKKRSVNKTSDDNQVPAQNVFDFINNTLGGKQGNVEDLKQNDHFNTLDRRKSGKPESHTNYNIELFKLEEEKARIQKQIKKQKDSLFRNSGRDSAVAEQAKHKMTVLSQKFKQLEDKEKLIQRRIHQNNEHKKLTVF